MAKICLKNVIFLLYSVGIAVWREPGLVYLKHLDIILIVSGHKSETESKSTNKEILIFLFKTVLFYWYKTSVLILRNGFHSFLSRFKMSFKIFSFAFLQQLFTNIGNFILCTRRPLTKASLSSEYYMQA